MSTTPLTQSFRMLVQSFNERHLTKILVEEYGFDTTKDTQKINEIKKQFIELLIENKYPINQKELFNRVKTKIKRELKPFVDDPATDINGLVLFRAKYYRKDFYPVIDYILEEIDADFLASCEAEMVDMISVAINKKKPLYEKVYIEFTKNDYVIRDKNDRTIITKKFFNAMESRDSFPGGDADYLICALVDNAPKSIMLINADKYLDMSSIVMLQKIFTSRIEFLVLMKK